MAEFCHPEFGCDCSKDQAQAKRLREALERIVDASDGESAITLKGIARAALS